MSTFCLKKVQKVLVIYFDPVRNHTYELDAAKLGNFYSSSIFNYLENRYPSRQYLQDFSKKNVDLFKFY